MYDQNEPVFDLADLLTFSQAAKLLPNRPHRSTLHRWADRGVQVGDKRIRLHALRLGGKNYTTEIWLKAFAVEAFAAAQKPIAKKRRRPLNKNADTDTALLEKAGV